MLRTLKYYLGLCGRRTTKPRRRNTTPRIESLESRWVPSTISGTVFNDVNNTGTLVPGEQGIAGDTIELHSAAGPLINSTTTDANGNYSFSTDSTINTQPTTQEVDATFADRVTNWSATQSVAQFDPSLGTLTGVDVISNAALTSAIKVQSLDSAPSHVTGHVSGEVTLTLANVTPLVTDIAADEAVDLGAYDNAAPFAGAAAHDFGPKTGTNSASLSLSAANTDLSAFVGTGQLTLTENAVATSSATGAGNLLSQINSTASGGVKVVYHYTPSNALKPGQYTVVEPQTPPGYFDGLNTADNIHPLPPSPQNIIPVTLNAQGDSTTNNFGKLKPSSLSGSVYVDNDNNGVRETGLAGIGGEPGVGGVTINLNGTDDRGNAINRSAVTAADGSYGFDSLRPGTYALTEPQQPSGYLAGMDSIGSQGGTVGANAFTNINLPPGVDGVNNNFGEIQPSQIGGFVYFDQNNNGVKDAGEQGIANVTVYLSGMNAQGTRVNQAVQTNPDGSYNFGVLYPGSYILSDQQPAGYLPGQVTLGNLGGTQDPSHLFVTLGANATGTDYNFGNVLPTPPPPPPPPNPAPPPTVIAALQSPQGPLTKRMFTGGDWTRWTW
jgi:hypothetical protein